MVAARAQAQLSRLVQRGFHDGGRRAEELDAVGAARRQLAHPFAPLLRRMDGLDAVVDRREHRVHHHAGRGDLVGGGQLALLQRPAQPAHGAHLPHRGHAVRQPQPVNVVGRRNDAAHGVVRRADMRVRVHEARRHELAVAIDLVVSRARTPLGIDGLMRRADVHQPRDPLVFDHDVHRPPWRRARAVDDGGAAQDQAGKRPQPAVAGHGRRGRMPALGGIDVAGLFADFRLHLRGIAHGAYAPSPLCSMTPPFMISAMCSPWPSRQDRSR
ncbi:hypothetical protein D9M68_412860 [compost metagenome]